MPPETTSPNTLHADVEEGTGRLDLEWTGKHLRQLYDYRELTDADIGRCFLSSLCFGLYIMGKQIGFARVVTDRAVFSTVAEIVIDEKFQRQGYGRQLLQAALAHPWVSGTICIACSRRAPEFFDNLGFKRVHDWVGQRMPR
jgi:GNAT superfamily N-acetyltransferase